MIRILDTVVLISCSKLKRSYACAARELYDASPLFRHSLAYARQLASPIYILSAKYGLLPEDQIIAPYNESLTDKTSKEKLVWGQTVVSQIQKEFNPEQTRFVILAGRNYYEDLLPYLPNFELPLQGMRMGERIAALEKWCSPVPNQGEEVNELCAKLHELFCNMPRFHSKTIDQVPWKDGIYIMFETGEQYRKGERIVRIGTHTSPGRLKRRLKDHYLAENKDGSIFRKNIGRAMLNKNNHPYLPVWSFDSSDKNMTRHRFGDAFDEEFQAQLEKQISRYLQSNVTFTCFPVPEANKRLRYEEGIISTLNRAPDFIATNEWRGRFSPVKDIRESGLWLVRGLDAMPLTQNEYHEIVSLCSKKPGSPVMPVSEQRSNSVFEKLPAISPQPGIKAVVDYLRNKIQSAGENGAESITIRSGELHTELNLKNRMPTVCDAMYKLQKSGDLVLERPPKGRGSRLVITYYTKQG